MGNRFVQITQIFIVLTIVAIACFDVWVILNGGTEASVSQMIITWSYEYPVFTFLSGFTMGHLFWKISQKKEVSKT